MLTEDRSVVNRNPETGKAFSATPNFQAIGEVKDSKSMVKSGPLLPR
jgi:hypothetical protein